MSLLKTILTFLFFIGITLNAQIPNKIKVKKQSQQVFFYQKGSKTDTITKTSGNVFYFVVSDALKRDVSVFVENGQLLKTSNDSLYTFRYVKGMSYECVFKAVAEGSKNSQNKFEYKVLVNGISTEPPHSVIIRLKEDEGYSIENRFYYKD